MQLDGQQEADRAAATVKHLFENRDVETLR
jgi:hypothetical protein